MNRRPNSILRSLSCLLLLAGLAAPAVAGPPPFTSTTLVGCTGAPVADGAALLAANAAATAPALLQLEPCTYDLSGAELVMRNLVDIAGSGRDVTVITSTAAFTFTGATVRVPAGIATELRQLTVRNDAAGNGTGISAFADDFLLTEVNVETKVGGNAVGVLTTNSSPRLNEVFVNVLAKVDATGVRINGGGTVVTESFSLVASEGDDNVAWDITEGASPVLERVVALAFSGDSNTAVSIHNRASADLDNVRGTAFGGTEARGLHIFKQGVGDVKESTFKATNDTLSIAFDLEDGTAKATESTFIASPFFIDHVSVFAARLGGSSNLDSNQSNYESTSFAVQNLGSGQGRFGASQLIGSVFTSSLTGLKCIFSYNGSYNARNSICG